MTGSLRPRGDGRWQLVVSVGRDPVTHRYKQVTRTFHGPKRQAERALAELVTETGADSRHRNSEATVGQLVDAWLDQRADDLSPTTLAGYRSKIALYIRPAWGSLALGKVTPADLDRWYRNMVRERGLAPATVKQVHAIMRGAFRQAVRWGWITSSPVDQATAPRSVPNEISPPTSDVVRSLFELAASRPQPGPNGGRPRHRDPDLATFLRMSAATGARRGEVCGLRWTDVDLEEGSVVVARSVVEHDGQVVLKDTKTHAARRIALDAGAVTALRSYRDLAEKRAAEAGTTVTADAFVFSRRLDGAEPVRPALMTAAWRRLCEAAGVTGVRLHDLRHLHVTSLLTGGVDVRTVAGRVGHANPATTLRVYAAWVPAADRAAADVIAAVLAGP